MTTDEKFMSRCLQLALAGRGKVSPNPMVGAVIVRNGMIIGEGYHRLYGAAHAEVNALQSVEDKSLISGADMYVSLEPCSHFGKTPPCANRIIQEGIKKVIIAVEDPNPAVSGRGIRLLKEAGIEVVLHVLEEEARMLNKEFFTYQQKRRPYIYLKWAQTKDNYIDKQRLSSRLNVPTPISTPIHQQIVHKVRSEIMAIMVGTNTAIKDNPRLTTRLWAGNNPCRIVPDRTGRIPLHSHLFNDGIPTYVYTEQVSQEITRGNVRYIPETFDRDVLCRMMSNLRERKISSLLVEGGAILLQQFIDQGLWDEAFIEIADKEFGGGVSAPHIVGNWQSCQEENTSFIFHLTNKGLQ